MIKNKKQMFLIIGSFALVLMLFTTTYAFFNYTRTGVSNVIKVGRIYFNSEQTSINLTNVFPIDSEDVDTDTNNVGVATIHITGDTTYSGGIEYLVSAVDVNNTIGTGNNQKTLPISINVSYNANDNKTIGTKDNDYFLNRGGSESIYNTISKNIIKDDDKIAVGYIAKGQTGIDGILTIKAFLDKNKIAISDTYPPTVLDYVFNEHMSESEFTSCLTFVNEEWDYAGYFDSGTTAETFCQGTGTSYNSNFSEWLEYNYFSSEEIEYLKEHGILIEENISTNDTTDEWVNGRTVLTTTEWNSLQMNGISFKIKVEANEGTWVTPVGNAMNNISEVFKENNINKNIKEIYFNKMTESEMHQRYAAATIKDDLTFNNEGEVLAWLEPNSLDNTKYTMYIASDGITYLNIFSNIFEAADLKYANKIEFNNIDTSRVIYLVDMFSGMTLESLDISMFDTSNVTRMSGMFKNFTMNNTLDLSTLNFENVTYLSGMFGNSNIRNVKMNNLDFSKLKNIDSSSFANCNINTLDFSNTKFPILTSMNNLFGYSNINNLNLSNIYVPNLQTMEYTFSNATIGILNFGDMLNLPSLTNLPSTFISSNIDTIDLSSWKTSILSNMHATFQSSNATSIIFGSNFDTSNVSIFDYTFQSTKINSLDLSNFNTSSANDLNFMFSNCQAATIYVSDLWDTSNIPSTTNLFDNAAVVGEHGTKAYESCTVNNNIQTCTNKINTTGSEYARVDNPPDSPGYFTYKAHS